jgi:hypothetical protein
MEHMHMQSFLDNLTFMKVKFYIFEALAYNYVSTNCSIHAKSRTDCLEVSAMVITGFPAS